MEQILNFGNTRRRSEAEDFIVASLGIGLAFSIAFSRFQSVSELEFLEIFLPTGMTAGISGFALHEFAHRQFAIRYGYNARFRMWPLGVLIALTTSIFGFILALPGATEVYNVYDKNIYGKISAAGPACNIIVGILLITMSFFTGGIINFVTSISGAINFFLAFFNLLPIPPLDGYKVLSWDFTVYALLFGLSLVLLIAFGRGFF